MLTIIVAVPIGATLAANEAAAVQIEATLAHAVIRTCHAEAT